MDDAKPFFDAWAEFYDADYRDRGLGDVDFYVDLARDADGPVLEVGCGTGRIYLELLRAGVDADGFDVSEEMLTVLRENAAEAGLEPSVWRDDVTEFEPDREYALILVPFRTFLHNTTLADRRAALGNLRDALAPGGRLALNFYVPSFEVVCETYGERQTRAFTRDGTDYVVTERTTVVDEVEQVIETYRTIERDGETVREATYRMAMVSKNEFELLLETTGWSDWTGYGGFDYQPLEDGASEMVWIAEK